MNLTLQSALIELKNDGVILDPIVDLEHIITLHTLSLAISTPPFVPGEEAALRPVLKIGNLHLRRLSLGARRFLIDVVLPWFPNDTPAQDLAYAYCMAVGHEPEKLWAVQHSRARFKLTLWWWEMRVGVPFEELRAAVKEFLAEEKHEPATKPGLRDFRRALDLLHDWRPLPEPYKTESEAALIAMQVERDAEPSLYGRQIENLAKEYGRTPEDLIWRTPEPELDLLLYNRRERLDAELREIQGVQDDRFMRAHRAFCLYKDMVLRIKKGATQ